MSRRLEKRRKSLTVATLAALERWISLETSQRDVRTVPHEAEPGDYYILFSDETHAPLFGPEALAADLVMNGYKIVSGLTRTPPKKRQQRRLLEALTPEVSVELSAFFAHAVARLCHLLGPEEGWKAVESLLDTHFPLDAPEQAALGMAENCYTVTKELHREVSQRSDRDGEPVDMSVIDFVVSCTAYAVEMIPGGEGAKAMSTFDWPSPRALPFDWPISGELHPGAFLGDMVGDGAARATFDLLVARERQASCRVGGEAGGSQP